MATIGVKDILPKFIGAVIRFCTGDEVQLHKKRLNIVLYLPYSPVNILSTTELDEYIKDHNETCLPKKRKFSIFTWNFWKYKNTIARSENYLP